MIIQVDNLFKSYLKPGSSVEQEVLKGLNLSLNMGERISITGASGCGKSTLLNILGTLDSPSGGSVLFDGKDLLELPEKDLVQIRNKKIGFVFQQHHLLPQLSLIENVLLPLLDERDKEKKREALNRAKDLLDYVGLKDRLDHFPHQLSGGECQRTAVVRALINEPQLLLADEPTGSLDEKSSILLVDLLLDISMKKGLSLVMVTHSDVLAHKMDRVYLLENGQLKIS